MDNLESWLKNHIERDQERMDRIEGKIDKLADTVVALARAEEKLVSLEQHRSSQDKRIDQTEKDLNTLFTNVRELESKLSTNTKLIFLVLTAIVGLALM